MAITSHWYSAAGTKIVENTLFAASWLADTINLALVTSSYTPNLATHSTWADVNAFEISGIGYVAGGQTLTTKVVGPATATRYVSAASATWTGATFTARYAVLYRVGGSPGASPLLSLVDFGNNRAVVASTFLVGWDLTNGILATTPV